MANASDVRYAMKLLLKQKGFTAAALLTLALCIGANTAIFSVVNSILLKPLPFEGADRLVTINNSYPRAGVERGGASVPDYYDRQELSTLQAVAMFTAEEMTIGETGRPERTDGMAVTPSLFPILGVSAATGRTFLAEEGELGNEHKAVLSWQLWQERFGGSPAAVGSTIRVDDRVHTVVGVMPRDFVFHDPEVRLWVPLAFTAEQRSDDARHSNSWAMLARLRPGATVEQAQKQVDALNTRVEERTPQYSELLMRAGFRSVVADYRDELTREVRDTLWLLQGGVLLVLLIGCLNIANLVLVRSMARHREMATRAALGASPARLTRQLIVEGLILAVTGGVLGVLLGWAAVRAFATFAAERLPRGAEVDLDGTALLVVLLASVVAGLIFSVVPAARLRRADLGGVFRDEGRTGTAGRTTTRWRSALVTAQVSLAFTVLVTAGLLMTSFSRTLAVDPGFEPAGVLTASVSLPVTRYDETARRQFADRLLAGARALPGIRSAAVTNILPFGGEMNTSTVTAEGYASGPDDALIAPASSTVSDGYFEALGIDLVAGRTFTASDRDDAAPVVVVDRALADHFWPGQDPIGRRIAPGVPTPDGDPLEYRTVVGVVDEVRIGSLTGKEPMGHLYMPTAQVPPARLFVVLETAGEASAATAALRAAVTRLDPDLPVYEVRTMEERLSRSVATDRLRMTLLTGFGALALFLAAVGLYGVLAYSVAQRGVEIAIRIALGSSAAAVFRTVVGQGARMIGIGLALGLAVTIALGRLVRSMLYGVEPADPLVLLAVVALLSAAALTACVVPARRAMRVDPAVVIRGAG